MDPYLDPRRLVRQFHMRRVLVGIGIDGGCRNPDLPRCRNHSAVTPWHFRAYTTDSHHDLPVAPNRLSQNFAAGRPNQIWLLCANLRRMALSGRRARSLYQKDRRLGDARSPAGSRLRQKTQSRWRRQIGNHPLSQALRRPRDLRLFMRRSTAVDFIPENHLTNIGASMPR
jgi:hypothetical protein